jgi:polar amino acid transport system substrate-binding protein
MLRQLAVACLLSFIVCSDIIANDDTLTASMPSFSPFASFDENIKCEGTISKLLKMIFLRADIKLNLVNYPYARILHSLNSGALDTALIFKNTSIVQNVKYLGPVSKSRVIVLTSADITINSYADLPALNAIAVIRNAHFDKRFDQDDTIKKVNVDSYEQGIKMLKYGRVDAIVGSLVGLKYSLKQENMEQKRLDTAFILGEKEWWLHISKKSPYLKNIGEIEQAIKYLYKDDLVYQLYKTQLNACVTINQHH